MGVEWHTSDVFPFVYAFAAKMSEKIKDDSSNDKKIRR